MSRDTWPGNGLRSQTINGWNYVEGNPINFTDPFGYFKCDPLTGICDGGYGLCVVQGQWRGSYVNGKPCIVNPDNVQTNVPPPLPPPRVQRPEEKLETSDECPINPQTGLTQCEMFAQEVEQIITLTKGQGVTDGVTVMVLAQYYSKIRITGPVIKGVDPGMLLPGNPAVPRSYFRDQDKELYGISERPSPREIAQYGFKKNFWNNTHHYFADFYHNYFLGDTISTFGAVGREIAELAAYQFPVLDPYIPVPGNRPEEVVADLQLYTVVRRHVYQTTNYSTMLGAYKAPFIPGKIEILPTLLRRDACESLIWVWPPRG